MGKNQTGKLKKLEARKLLTTGAVESPPPTAQFVGRRSIISIVHG